MEEITIAEINRHREENKRLKEEIVWKNNQLNLYKQRLETSKKITEKLGNCLENVFSLIDKITELETKDVLKELQKEARVIEIYNKYKNLG